MDIVETGERQERRSVILRTFYSLVNTCQSTDLNKVSPSQHMPHFRAMQKFEQEQMRSLRDYGNGSNGYSPEPPSAA